LTETNPSQAQELAKSLLVNEEETNQTAVEEEPAIDEPVEDIGTGDDTNVVDQDLEQNEIQETQEETEPLYDVKVDGEVQQWTLSELQRSASGQGYLNKRMQETAAMRKQAEEAYQQVQSQRAELERKLKEYTSQFNNIDLEKPDISELETDPIGYQVKKAKYDEAIDQRRRILAEQSKLDEEKKAQQQKAQEYYLSEQASKLQSALPIFAKEETAKAAREELVSAGKKYGFTSNEVGSIMDHRAILVLHDAAKWQALQNKKGVAEKKVSNARPMVKSGSRPTTVTSSQRTQKTAFDQFKKTGNKQDAVSYLIAASQSKS
tara:strand:- start:18596 stop:19555 length:960 start_codon:yes stop_codon:yes gene_type:complete